MKAAVYRGPHNIKLEEVPEPEVKAGRVLVHFKAGSLCGTDMHFYRGDWKWMKKGRIIGHDAWGIREDTGRTGSHGANRELWPLLLLPSADYQLTACMVNSMG